jgi:phosphopantetheinyl transferase (holo-ACP synthase)
MLGLLAIGVALIAGVALRMFLSGMQLFDGFAVATIPVVLIAMLGSVTVLPALLSVLGDRVDLGRVRGLARLRRPQGGSRTWAALPGPCAVAYEAGPTGFGLARQEQWAPVVRRLGCLRGVSTLTGFALAVEIGDWDRFTGATIGAYLGLVPTESSSGARRAQGSIPKTGNTRARRLLVEAAWHHRKNYDKPSVVLTKRWAQMSPLAKARGHAGNHRLHRRWLAFTARGKRPVVANVAIARELAGWCWSLAVLDED